MKSSKKSAEQAEVGIADYYAVKVGAIFRGAMQENFAFWCLCTYFFFEYVRPQALYPVIDVLPWAQIALVISCLGAFFDRSVKWVSNPGNSLLIMFFLVILLSILFAFDPAASLKKIDIIINWVILYFLMITVINSEKRFFIFMLLFFLVHFKMSQFGLRSFLMYGYSSYGVSGAPGWFKDAGDLGIAMTIFIALTVAFIQALHKYWGRYKVLLFCLLPISGVATLIATSARGPQLGLVAAGLWMLLKRKRRIQTIIILLVAGTVIYMLLPDKMIEEYMVAGEDATSLTRLMLWSWGMEVFRDNPVLGVGYYNWIDYCYFIHPEGIGHLPHCLVAHSAYVTAAAETGVLGFALYVLMALFMLVENARTRSNAHRCDNRFLVYISHGLDGGLIAYLVGSVFFSVLFYPMFWVQLAMTVTLHEISKKQLREKNRMLKTVKDAS